MGKNLFPVTEALADAYRATDYVTRDATFAIGVWHARIDRALSRRQARAAVFVTACNPRGKLSAPSVNFWRQRRLRAHVRALGLRFVPGNGVGHGGDWPPESSLLVFGVDARRAMAIGRRFQQNAVVFVARRSNAALLPLR